MGKLFTYFEYSFSLFIFPFISISSLHISPLPYSVRFVLLAILYQSGLAEDGLTVP